MADNSLGTHLAFDRGIDLITYVRQDETQSLPRREEGPPSELGGRPQLESLLAQPTLDQFLEDAIRPKLDNRELMVPSRFQSILDSLHSDLSDLSEHSEELEADPSGADATAPSQKKRILQRAVRLLNSERDLRGLVQMYRSVLYQG